MKKSVIVVLYDPKRCMKQLKYDHEILKSQGISSFIDRSERTLETESSIIRYFHENNLDDMRGFNVDIAIVHETWEGYPDWEDECLSPALCMTKGSICKLLY